MADEKIGAPPFGPGLRDLEWEEWGIETGWWWLSFTDPDQPEGSRFLGACLVDALSLPLAISRSHLLGINPGGAVLTVGPLERSTFPDDYPTLRLLSAAEIAEHEPPDDEKAPG